LLFVIFVILPAPNVIGPGKRKGQTRGGATAVNEGFYRQHAESPVVAGRDAYGFPIRGMFMDNESRRRNGPAGNRVRRCTAAIGLDPRRREGYFYCEAWAEMMTDLSCKNVS
jgi:hypothetical protein